MGFRKRFDQHRRLERILSTTRGAQPPQIYEVETSSPTPSLGGAQTDLVKTHTDPNLGRMYVGALRLHGILDAVRLGWKSSGFANTSVAFALYLGPPLGSKLRLVQKFGAADVTDERISLGRRVRMDPRRGVYWLGWTTNDKDVAFVCPGHLSGAAPGMARRGRSTAEKEDFGTFPDEVHMLNDSVPLPWMSLRSEEGVHLFGESTVD